MSGRAAQAFRKAVLQEFQRNPDGSNLVFNVDNPQLTLGSRKPRKRHIVRALQGIPGIKSVYTTHKVGGPLVVHIERDSSVEAPRYEAPQSASPSDLTSHNAVVTKAALDPGVIVEPWRDPESEAYEKTVDSGMRPAAPLYIEGKNTNSTPSSTANTDTDPHLDFARALAHCTWKDCDNPLETGAKSKYCSRTCSNKNARWRAKQRKEAQVE